MMPASFNAPFTLSVQCRKEATNEPAKANYVETLQLQVIKVATLEFHTYYMPQGRGEGRARGRGSDRRLENEPLGLPQRRLARA